MNYCKYHSINKININRNIPTILILMFDVFVTHPKIVKIIKIVSHSSNKIAYKYPITKLTHITCSKSTATVSYSTDSRLTIWGLFWCFFNNSREYWELQKTPLYRRGFGVDVVGLEPTTTAL